jgi:hypothetical protein
MLGKCSSPSAFTQPQLELDPVRFLANENIPRSVIAGLRQRGHDVLSAKESLRGRPDRDLLAQAQVERRVLVTQDKDFGEIAFRSRLPAECGVLLFRFADGEPGSDKRRMIEAIQSRTDWMGHFSVVTETQVRMRRLAPPSPFLNSPDSG